MVIFRQAKANDVALFVWKLGDRNIGINIGTAGDITLGNLSSGRNPDD
ncbi:hypothetical protein OGM63_11770 [Plectonema radiosum NIES-515]|uniref:Uncharacterized protein n=1 Tax=Plectonema radiosum NIES-515 TaxID=2986073 RepID=A0ABT3AYW2_9CYAN|nr:hypothetical protein [Plectonema radiosum]MCV3214180.1 hypothetical protein [Plectonema radiosum NIES-515]